MDNEDVVGAAPTGEAPTTTELSTMILPTKVRLILEVWRYYVDMSHINTRWNYNFTTVPNPTIQFQILDADDTHQSLLCCLFESISFCKHPWLVGWCPRYWKEPLYNFCVNIQTLRPRQNGRHFPDDISRWISWMKMYELQLKLHCSTLRVHWWLL